MLLDYLNKFSDAKQLTVIGPLLERSEEEHEPLIFVDGGARWRKNVGFSVGDGDSFAGQLDQVLPKEKDFSDLAFVLREIRKLNIARIVLKGFLGGRRDHELANFGEVHHFLTANSNRTEVWFDSEVVALTPGKWQLSITGIFSVYSFVEAAFAIKGSCKYQAVQRIQVGPLNSHGLSNEGFGMVEIETSSPVFIFFSKEL